MNPIEQIARCALSGDALLTRSLLLDWLATTPSLTDVPRPTSQDPTEVSLSAALAELLSARLGQQPPPWTTSIGAAPKPTHLLKSTANMSRLREMCETESPLPLRRRQIFAPANYLEMR